MSPYFFSFLIGLTVGLRTLTAPAVVSWAARLGWLPLQDTWLAFLGFSTTPYILTALALGELVGDKLPMTPSRKGALGFTGRVMSGALCGAALGSEGGSWVVGAMAGVAGSVIGTLGGYELRVRAARALGKDLPIALLEDVIAIGSAALIVSQFA